MDIYLLDAQRQTIGIVDDFNSFIWRRKYKECGDFELHCSPSAASLIASAKYVYRSDRPEAGKVEQLALSDSKAVIKGRFLESMLDDFVIYPTQKFSSKTPEEIALSIVSTFANIPIGAITGLGSNVDSQSTGDNLMEYIYEVLSAQDLSPRIAYDYMNDTLSFSVWQGKDRRQSQNENSWAVFSQNWDNLKSSSYSYSSKDFRNFAYVAGEGEGSSRKIVTVDLSNGLNRRSIWVDARDLQPDDMTDAEYKKLLIQRGTEKLAEYPAVEKFDVTIANDSSLKYMVDYDLGDICTVSDANYGITLDARIIEIEEAYENGELTLFAQFGEGYLSVTKYLRRRFQ